MWILNQFAPFINGMFALLIQITYPGSSQCSQQYLRIIARSLCCSWGIQISLSMDVEISAGGLLRRAEGPLGKSTEEHSVLVQNGFWGPVGPGSPYLFWKHVMSSRSSLTTPSVLAYRTHLAVSLARCTVSYARLSQRLRKPSKVETWRSTTSTPVKQTGWLRLNLQSTKKGFFWIVDI